MSWRGVRSHRRRCVTQWGCGVWRRLATRRRLRARGMCWHSQALARRLLGAKCCCRVERDMTKICWTRLSVASGSGESPVWLTWARLARPLCSPLGSSIDPSPTHPPSSPQRRPRPLLLQTRPVLTPPLHIPDHSAVRLTRGSTLARSIMTCTGCDATRD